MQLIDGAVVHSATDLVGFLACEHLTNLERAAVVGLVERPERRDPELDLIAQRGLEHERRFLAQLRSDGSTVADLSSDEPIGDAGERLRAGVAATLEAMRSGVDAIYQATLADGGWRGYADFLRRVERPSDLGSWSYEVWDTKLARHTKGSAILQLCLYTDLLERAQGRLPDLMHVALGGSSHATEHHRTADYLAYYRLVRGMYESTLDGSPPVFPPATRPDPVEHCDVCRWNLECAAVRRSADDLSLVAGITARQRRALRERDVPTRRALAGLQLPVVPPLEGSSREAIARVREQARIQVEGEDQGRILSERFEPAHTRDGGLEPDRGLLALPEPSAGDLFFDIEGDPFAFDDGIDYLFGVLEPGRRGADGGPLFHAFWSRDAETGEVTPEAEKRAFEALIDLIVDRRRADPGLHVYHYAPYEPTAMGRLMGRHATREAEVDDLLRGRVFIDLFRAVRQGIRASVESYSIKRLEPLYGFSRTVDLRDAGSSIVAFETWLQLGGDPVDDPGILQRIKGYNRDDCVSNLRLRDWLEGQRAALEADLGEPLPRPAAGEPARPELREALARVAAVESRLVDGVPADATARTAEQHGRWLLAQLLSWHRREDKSAWWRYYRLLELTDEERIDERDALAGLEYVGIVEEVAQSYVHRYRYPPQEHDIDTGSTPVDPATRSGAGVVVRIDDATGTIELKRGKGSLAPHPTSLIPRTVVDAPEQREALLRLGGWVADHGIDDDGPWRAARDLLLRRVPRLAAGATPGAQIPLWRDGPLTRPDEPGTEAVRRLVPRLDRSYLAVQGPPGSGKTTVGAELIVDLVLDGCRVGVMANSHKVIGHLLDTVAEKAAERGETVRIGQKPGRDEDCTSGSARCLRTNGDVRRAIESGDVDVVGGTAWVWAREDVADLLDVLVVDEAGQVSLANVVAVSGAARSLVLLGDPQQLDQPLQGSHPPGADRSALAHLLDERATIPPELGVLLERTWRLHPDICAFTSEAFYECDLRPAAGTERQRLDGAGVLDGTGLRFVPVVHAGDRNDSAAEAQAVAAMIRELVDAGGSWTDTDGRTRPLGSRDVLVITPYNAQVRELRSALETMNAGTVDRFQGQQAPVSIYSMATSSPEEAPRGMEFLYSLHRLNVATSRARCLAVVVASPELVRVRCMTPRQMRLANGLARFVELAVIPAVPPA